MNYMHLNDKFQQKRTPQSKAICELYAQLATAPDEIEHPIICSHFWLATKQQIQQQIEAETRRLQKRGGAANV